MSKPTGSAISWSKLRAQMPEYAQARMDAKLVMEQAARIAERPGFIQARDTEWDEGVEYAKKFIAAAIRSKAAAIPDAREARLMALVDELNDRAENHRKFAGSKDANPEDIPLTRGAAKAYERSANMLAAILGADSERRY